MRAVRRAVQVVAMGVSGTGKSEVGSRVASHFGMEFIEGDAHHPKANIDKMSAGIPLDDDDRHPWLVELAGILAASQRLNQRTLLTCSALRRPYRDLLRDDLGDGSVIFLHLVGGFDVLHERMAHRSHFMPASLLQSQLDTLEPLGADEAGAVIDVDAPLETVVARSIEALRPWLEN